MRRIYLGILLLVLTLSACEELTDSTDTFSISVDGAAASGYDEGLTDPLMVAAQDAGSGATVIWFMQGLDLGTTTFAQTLAISVMASGGTGTFVTNGVTTEVAAVYGQNVNASVANSGNYFAIDPSGNNEVILTSNGAAGGTVSGSYSFDLCSYDPAGPTLDCGTTKTVSGSFSVEVEDTAAPGGLGL